MNPVPARRRPVASLLLGALAMGSSFTVLGALVLSDVAAAGAPPAPALEKVAYVKQGAPVNTPSTVSEPDALEPMPEEKSPPKKRARKKAKVDFGRFEGY